MMPVEAIAQRVNDIANRVERIERTEPAVTAAAILEVRQDIKDLREENRETRNEVSGLRKAIIGAAIVFGTSSLATSLAVLIGTGKL